MMANFIFSPVPCEYEEITFHDIPFRVVRRDGLGGCCYAPHQVIYNRKDLQ